MWSGTTVSPWHACDLSGHLVTPRSPWKLLKLPLAAFLLALAFQWSSFIGLKSCGLLFFIGQLLVLLIFNCFNIYWQSDIWSYTVHMLFVAVLAHALEPVTSCVRLLLLIIALWWQKQLIINTDRKLLHLVNKVVLWDHCGWSPRVTIDQETAPTDSQIDFCKGQIFRLILNMKLQPAAG